MANASIKKRIKITKNGKMVRRKAAQSHFRANKSGSQIRQKRNPTNVASPDVKQIENYLNR